MLCYTHHAVWVVDVDVVVLPAGRLLNKRLVDAHAIQLNIVLLHAQGHTMYLTPAYNMCYDILI
jgi:hypothetical protein